MINANIKKEDINQLTNISHQNNYNKSERVNRAKAIRLKCLDCMVYQPKEVKLCTDYNCPLWRYRMGKEEQDELYNQSHPKK